MGLRQRFGMLDVRGLLEALGGVKAVDFRHQYEALLVEQLAKDQVKRDPQWTESIAVGSEGYVREMEGRIHGRQQLVVEGGGGTWILKEAAAQ